MPQTYDPHRKDCTKLHCFQGLNDKCIKAKEGKRFLKLIRTSHETVRDVIEEVKFSRSLKD